VTGKARSPGRQRVAVLVLTIKDACSRELMDLGLSFNSLNIKAVLSEAAEARRRESAARAKADADVVRAQEEQRARIAQLEAAGSNGRANPPAAPVPLARRGSGGDFSGSMLMRPHD
jgi:hypothetical protein